eukprot:3208010-Pyramimonas_sp.AAC.1
MVNTFDRICTLRRPSGDHRHGAEFSTMDCDWLVGATLVKHGSDHVLCRMNLPIAWGSPARTHNYRSSCGHS